MMSGAQESNLAAFKLPPRMPLLPPLPATSRRRWAPFPITLFPRRLKRNETFVPSALQTDPRRHFSISRALALVSTVLNTVAFSSSFIPSSSRVFDFLLFFLGWFVRSFARSRSLFCCSSRDGRGLLFCYVESGDDSF